MSKISAGSYDLNRWLYGGYENDVITVVYGSPGSGKTNFCLLAAVSQAKNKKKVIYIDTEGGFSAERVKQIASEDTEEVLKNIFLLKPTNFEEQKEAFEKILEYLKQEISLIVVDGMTMLYRLDFASAREKDSREMQNARGHPYASPPDQMQKVNSELAKQMRTLAEIARKRGIAVIVTNQTYMWENVSKMVGGDILKYWAKCIIELTNEEGKRSAYLKKHRSLPEKSLQFQITNEGIRKRGWI